MVKRYREDEIPAVYNRDEVESFTQREGLTMQGFRSLDKSVGFVTAEPNAETNLHKHPWEQIVYVLAGETDFFVNGEEFTVSEGDFFFVPPNTEHDLRPGPDQGCTLMTIWSLREDYDERTAYQTEFQDEE